jgi:hypothetical protein
VTKAAWNLQISTTFTRDSLSLPGVQILSFSIGLEDYFFLHFFKKHSAGLRAYENEIHTFMNA